MAAEVNDLGVIRAMVLAMPSEGLWVEGSGCLPHITADYQKRIVEGVTERMEETNPQ